MVFDYVAKSGQERYVALADDLVRQAVRDLLRRRSGGPELLAYRDDGTWRDVSSADINAYIKEKVGGEVSAKDFRTWHGTVIAAVALAEANEKARTVTARKRAVAAAMRQVSDVPGQHPGGRAQVVRGPSAGRPVLRRGHDLSSPGLDRHGPGRRYDPRPDRAGGAETCWSSNRRFGGSGSEGQLTRQPQGDSMYLYTEKLINDIAGDEPDRGSERPPGGTRQFGEMRTMTQYLFQSINFRGDSKAKPYNDLSQGVGTEESATSS